jgi:hypothetical protein
MSNQKPEGQAEEINETIQIEVSHKNIEFVIDSMKKINEIIDGIRPDDFTVNVGECRYKLLNAHAGLYDLMTLMYAKSAREHIEKQQKDNKK